MTNPRDMTIEELITGCKNYVRIANCLHNEKIKTVGELVDFERYKGQRYWVTVIENLGSKSIKEIKDRLNYFGWVHDGDKWQPPKQYDAPAPTPPAEKTLRDEIAINAMKVLLTDNCRRREEEKDIIYNIWKYAYELADYMLAERNKPVLTDAGE